MERKISFAKQSQPVIEGAGVKLRRAFSHELTKELDPFLLLDDFSSENPDDYIAGFPLHPHRGIEAVTYLIDGKVEHKDSLGNSGMITGGQVQWMSAGSGIIHEEMPKKSASLKGFQLWINLPKRHKMISPRYMAITRIPETTIGNAKLKVISGTIGKVIGPATDNISSVTYLDVSLKKDQEFHHDVTTGDTVFCYIISGSALFADKECTEKNIVVFDRNGDKVRIKANGNGCEFLLLEGRPLNEPIAWHGPIVMNTQEEIDKAIEELDTGNFIKEEPN